MKNWLYPKLKVEWLPAMVQCAGAGALIAGTYGIVHDQITYSISAEYFTKLKFQQFHYANFGFPVRVFVAEVGFLATWWVGLIAGWFLARIAVPEFSRAAAIRLVLRGFVMMLAFAAIGFALGYAYGLVRINTADLSGWQVVAEDRGVADLQAFVRVAYIHNAGYIGGLAGLVTAGWKIRRSSKVHR